MDSKERIQRYSVEQIQERIQKVSGVHSKLCNKIDVIIKDIDDAITVGTMLNNVIDSNLDTGIRLGRRIYLHNVIRDLMAAKLHLSNTIKRSRSIAPAQLQLAQESMMDEEHNFE